MVLTNNMDIAKKLVNHDRVEIAFLAKEIAIGNTTSISMNKIFENKDAPRKGDRMEVIYGKGTTEYGPGVDIYLTGEDVALAISSYLVAHDIHVSGPRTITINGELCKVGKVYVDPSGFVICAGEKYDGKGAARKI
jgi:hypothetical protein